MHNGAGKGLALLALFSAIICREIYNCKQIKYVDIFHLVIYFSRITRCCGLTPSSMSFRLAGSSSLLSCPVVSWISIDLTSTMRYNGCNIKYAKIPCKPHPLTPRASFSSVLARWARGWRPCSLTLLGLIPPSSQPGRLIWGVAVAQDVGITLRPSLRFKDGIHYYCNKRIIHAKSIIS
jgi:hypothetical protein